MIQKKCSMDTDYGKMDYLIHHPSDMKENLPILIFLHGIGECGDNIDDIKRYSFPAYIDNMEIPYVTICPQCSRDHFWNYYLRDIERILDKTIKEYKCDRSRVCIMGSSMGAVGAWDFIMQKPELFKCLISASGRAGMLIEETVSRITNKSFLIYHGTCDDIINYKNSVEIYDVLVKLGAKDVTLKLVDGGNHYICSTTYKEPEVYKWLVKKL